MQDLAKIGGITLEGDTMPPQDTGPKRQVNIYFPEETHIDLQALTLEEKRKGNRGYSVSQLVNDAVSLYLMVIRYHKEARSTQSVFDFTMGALKTFIDGNRYRK